MHNEEDCMRISLSALQTIEEATIVYQKFVSSLKSDRKKKYIFEVSADCLTSGAFPILWGQIFGVIYNFKPHFYFELEKNDKPINVNIKDTSVFESFDMILNSPNVRDDIKANIREFLNSLNFINA